MLPLFFSHHAAYKVPCRHLFQRAAHGLDVPKDESHENSERNKTRDAVELFDANHQEIGGIVGKSARHIVGHLAA